MLAVLFDADGNMLESRVDAGTAEFYAQIDNTSGDGEYIEVYFWNNFSELKEQAYILKLTPEGIFEE